MTRAKAAKFLRISRAQHPGAVLRLFREDVDRFLNYKNSAHGFSKGRDGELRFNGQEILVVEDEK